MEAESSQSLTPDILALRFNEVPAFISIIKHNNVIIQTADGGTSLCASGEIMLPVPAAWTV